MRIRRRNRAPHDRLAILALVSFLALPSPTRAESRWSLGAFLGGAASLPTPLVVRQAGAPELRVRARWATRALEFPLYYAARVEREGGNASWALSFTHHKVFLTNPTDAIQSFAISHGYNLLTIERLWRRHGLTRGAGLGVVLAHPEITVRGRPLSEHRGLFGAGYHLAGPTASLVLGRRKATGANWFGAAEARLTVSWARVPVESGNADVPNVALHGLVGLGRRVGP